MEQDCNETSVVIHQPVVSGKYWLLMHGALCGHNFKQWAVSFQKVMFYVRSLNITWKLILCHPSTINRLLVQKLHEYVIKSLKLEIKSPGNFHYLRALYFRITQGQYHSTGLLAHSLTFLPERYRSFPKPLRVNFNKWIHKVTLGSRYFC